MKQAPILALALLIALPSGSMAFAPPASNDPTPLDPATPAAAALATAARLRGFPDAIRVDARTELGLDRLTLGPALERYYAVAVGVPLVGEDYDQALAELSALTPEYQTGLAALMAALARARELREAAYAQLTHADLRYIYDVSMRAQFAPETVSSVEALRAVALIRLIDEAQMLHGAALVQSVAHDVRDLFGPHAAPTVAPTCTAFGALCIGTAGDDTYSSDVQLLIEPGGNDTYLNNAGGVLNRQVFDTTGGCAFGGGTTGKARPNLGCTPLPSQVCTYDTLNHLVFGGSGPLPTVGLPNHQDPNGPGGGQGNDGSCGSDERRKALFEHTADITNDADSRGVAALLDLDGSDTYTVPWVHDDPLFGLVDFCYPGETARVNTNRDLFQGGNLAGISFLWDSGVGNDVYRGRLNVQGSGHVGGVAVQIATGTGNDVFWADRLSQGDGVAGAVGVLATTKTGHHTFLLDAPMVYRNEFRPNGRDCAQEGRAGQGQGGFLGVGVLWVDNREATVVYRAVVQETTNAHPFNPILDANGDPILVGGNDAQGSGESFPIPETPGGLVVGVGLLFDRTDGVGTICPPSGTIASAGMVTGSAPSTGTDLSTRGVVDEPCGKFNLPLEFDPIGQPGEALQHLVAGAVGLRVVV